MSNITIVAAYVPFAGLAAGMFVTKLIKRTKQRTDVLLLVACLCIICWFASYMAAILVDSAYLIQLFIHIMFIIVGYLPPLILLFVSGFYHSGRKIPAKYAPLLFLIPTINAVLSLTGSYHALINANLEIISYYPLREIAIEWGPWFWVHAANNYVVSSVAIGIILRERFRQPKANGISPTLLLMGICVVLVGSAITLLHPLPGVMDLTLIGASLLLLFFDLAARSASTEKDAGRMRSQIFNHLSECILVLDEDKNIIDSNQHARDWFASRKIPLSGAFPDIIAELHAGNVAWKRIGSGRECDVILKDEEGLPEVMNLRIEPLDDTAGKELGSVAIFSDVTQQRLLKERLETVAGVDALTGLANAKAYTGAKKRMDSKGNYPLSIIVCDVNGLRMINERHGRRYGDIALQAVADTLTAACPKQGFVARTGDDGFIFLLPRTHSEAAYILMTRVREMLKSTTGNPFSVSAGMGTVTKYHQKENIDRLIKVAECRMEEDKRYMREKAKVVQREPKQQQKLEK